MGGWGPGSLMRLWSNCQPRFQPSEVLTGTGGSACKLAQARGWKVSMSAGGLSSPPHGPLLGAASVSSQRGG